MKRAVYLLAGAVVALLLLGACRSDGSTGREIDPPPATVASSTAAPAQTETRAALRPPGSTPAANAPNPVASATDVPSPSTDTESIHWYDWEPATFALAQSEDKPILLDLTAVWCHWCHVMDETSYSNPEVIRLANALYIPVRVDTDQRPDVQTRYLLGGWPTTAFLTPEGDILTGGTYIPPEELIPMLEGVSEYFASNEADITARVAEFRKVQAAARPQPASAIPAGTIQNALDRLEADYDATHGGFGQQPKFPVPAAIELIFRYHYTAGDAGWLERATHTLDGMGRLVDPVWGGLYRYSVTADWQTPHYEKLLSGNAEALHNYLEAYQATGEVAYRTMAEAVLGYVERFLWDPDGGFYGSQDADLVQPGGHGILLDGEQYFLLPETERQALGIPYVDTTLYTNWNGQMIAAMLAAAEVLEEPRYREMALLSLDRLWDQGRGPEGGMWHLLLDQGSTATSPPITLSDQVQFGLALLAAYSASGQREYLSRAKDLASYTLTELGDPESGGFYDLPADPTAPVSLGVRETSCSDNVVAARFFTRLYRVTAGTTYRDAAESALRLCASHLASSPEYALAAEEWLGYPLTLAVVGTPGEGETDALLAAGNRFYAPGKVVIPLDPAQGPPALGDFAYPSEPAAIYACRDRLCSLPATDPAELADRVQWLMTASDGG